MKNVISQFCLLFLCMSFAGNSYAERCDIPQLSFVSVVHYKEYSKALLTFHFSGSSLYVRVQREDGSELGSYVLPSGNPRLLLTNLPQKGLFSVFVEDACGQIVPAGWFETWPGMDNPEGIAVSEALFQATEQFVQQEIASLPSFMKNRKEIPLLDRLWFLQQYLYKGQPFEEDFGLNFPPDDFWSYSVPEIESCHCNLLFYGNANPSIMQEGVIYSVGATSSGDMGNNASFNLMRDYAGAAMDVELVTEGCRAGGDDYVFTYNAPMSEENSQLSGGAYGLLEYHFLCVGKDLVKEDCDCTRCVNVNASLSTKLDADVTLKTGCWSLGKDKWGYASAQLVYSLIHVSRKNGYQILAAGDHRAKKEAEIELNTEFFLALIDVASYLAPHLDSLTISLVDIDGLANALKNLIQEPVVEHNDSTGATIFEGDLFRTFDHQVCFQSNDPNRILLWVVSSVTGAGRRKWKSHALVQTGFHLDGIVEANLTENYCCSEQVGNWIAKSLIDNAIYSTYQMQARVVEDFALWPWDGWSPYNGLPGEYGYLTYSWGLCDSSGLTSGPDPNALREWWNMQVATTNTDISMHANEATVRQKRDDSGLPTRMKHLSPGMEPECPCRLEVIDLQGRVWYAEEGVLFESPYHLATQLQERGVFPHSGIFVLRLVGENGVRTEKVFVQK